MQMLPERKAILLLYRQVHYLLGSMINKGFQGPNFRLFIEALHYQNGILNFDIRYSVNSSKVIFEEATAGILRICIVNK